MKIVHMIKVMLGLAPNCEKVNQFLADYVEGTLNEKTRAQFQQHMDMCPCCGPYLDQYQTTIDMTHDCPCVEAPPELVEHTLSFLRQNADFNRS